MSDTTTIAAHWKSDGLHLGSTLWAGRSVGPLVASVTIDGTKHILRPERAADGDEFTVRLSSAAARALLVQSWRRIEDGWAVSCRLVSRANASFALNRVELLTLSPDSTVAFGSGAASLVMMEQGQYWGHVIPLFPADGQAESASNLVWVVADSTGDGALLIGFETGRRFSGRIHTHRRPPDALLGCSVGFDGGDLLVEPGETIELEDIVSLAGNDPLDLLDRYGERTHRRHNPDMPDQPPVSWCSWYPYRLGVSTNRVLANAQIGADRLKPLGLRIVEVDLGWEEGYLPSVFTENDQFPTGLKGLSDELRKLGFVLGVWAGPTSVSEFDPLAKAHPGWLVKNPDGRLFDSGQWFWEPHGAVHILDLTHPGAQGWLRERIRSLAERGARYLKADFVGNLSSGAAKVRQDRKVVGGGGVETGNLAIQIMRGAMAEVAPGCLFLDCGGPELPGPASAGLLYTCEDTGNTGYVGWHHLRRVLLATATHLFKNRRWGIIQPSCLCVGLPGTISEARVRATMAFMAGGQVDISDDLTTLPEDRWRILTATLPPHGVSARPIDLFRPVKRTSGGYSTQGTAIAQADLPAAPPASVWALPVEARWGSWSLVAVFNFDEPEQKGERREVQMQTYFLPLERLGLDPAEDVWAYEFWSGQFCGCLPADAPPPPRYTHPGDLQMPIRRPDAGTLAVSFFGPGAALFALRPRVPHPWVVGTSFHQTCGNELSTVRWDPGSRTLSGVLSRPKGETGSLAIAGFEGRAVRATVDGQDVPVRAGARGSVVLPIIARSDETPWEVCE